VSNKDIFFYTKKKKGPLRYVELPKPRLEYPLADSHAHLENLPDVPLALARSGFYGIDFICNMVEVSEDADTGYDCLDAWCRNGQKILDEMLTTYDPAAPLPVSDDREPYALGEVSVGKDLTGDYPVEKPRIPDIRVAIGCHPHNAVDYTDEVELKLVERLADPRTCALGEVGLDYYYDHSPRDTQREEFRRQIRIAHVTGLPIILHLREAHGEAYQILCEEGFPEAGVLLHCFNQDWETLEPWVEKDCFVALGGAVTFGRSEETREALKRIQPDRILTETDSPYMTPEPMRGRRCEPAHTLFTAAFMAEVLGYHPGEERAQFLAQLYANARALQDREPNEWQQKAQQDESLIFAALQQNNEEPRQMIDFDVQGPVDQKTEEQS